MTRATLLALLAAFLLAGATVAAPLPPFLSDAPADQAVRVLVKVAGRADLNAVTGDTLAVNNLLKEHAERTQAPVLAEMDALGLTDRRVFWATNMIAVTATPAQIKQLLGRTDVEDVFENAIIPMPEVTETELPAEGEMAWGVKKIQAHKVWSDLGITGQGVVVGIIDTGVDASHPDLAGKVIGFKDFVSRGNTEPRDGQGHGTHCSGTIAGGGSRAIGVAPDAKIIMARVFTARGASTETLLEAMEWIMDPDGDASTNDAPKLVSNSWGSNSRTDKSFWEICENWRAAGIHPVFAAGNAGSRSGTVGIPGGYPHVTAVGATTSSDGIASFSSRGPVKWNGKEMIKPEISAPGAGVLSARDGGGYRNLSGTSMACPHVSGLLALMYQARPDLTIDEAEALLESTALDLGEPGKDNDFGSGRVQALQVLSQLRASRIKGTITDESGRPLAARVEVLDTDRVADAATNGGYSISLTPGTWTLRFSLFGYTTETRTVELSEDQIATVDVAMQSLPSGHLTGRVLSASGQTLAAKVTVLDTPLATVETDASDGKYGFTLPAGSYRIRVVARGYEVRIFSVQVQEGANPRDLVMGAGARPYLLIDDDGGKDYEDYYRPSISEELFSYRDVATQGAIRSGDELAPHQAVIWFTGETRGSIGAEQQAALKSYLDEGGRLFLAGQNAVEGLKSSAFLKDSLHTSLKDGTIGVRGPVSPTSGDPIGAALMPFQLGDPGSVEPKSADALDPLDARASGFLKYSTRFFTRYAGLRVEAGGSKAVLIGFGLENIGDPAARHVLMRKSLAWLVPGAGTLGRKFAEGNELEARNLADQAGALYGVGTDAPDTEAIQEFLSGAGTEASTAAPTRNLRRTVNFR